MRIAAIGATLSMVLTCSGAAGAGDLVWEVENPFRFFKPGASFALHENAFKALRGQGPLPADIVWRIERRLNDPDCRDTSSPDACAATRRARYEQSRLGWAAQTLNAICYDNNARPRRYPGQCERRYSWGVAKEDYVLPEAHTVAIGIAPETLGANAGGACVWSWQPRKPGGRAETRSLPCKDKLVIARVPFALDRPSSGVSVTVRLADGRELAEPDVVVEDVFLVALGDSFASGESNPDRPVTFSAAREMVYDPVNVREDEVSTGKVKPQSYDLAAAPEKFDPKSLPKRLMADEESGRILRPSSREFAAAFNQRAARWLSADCHRSQYGYPFRVGIQLALENRHRAVTLVSFACSGADLAQGMFLEKPSREGFTQAEPVTVSAQLDQLTELTCRSGARSSATYTLPVYAHGSTVIETRQVTKRWCPPAARKRPVDLVLMSLGGNDVGFSALATYAMTENAADLAPIAGWIGHQIRFGPNVSRAYLNVLDRRMQALKTALRDGFGIEPSRVVQTAYEPPQFDEGGQFCGTQPALGMDVHPGLKLSRDRFADVADFVREFQARTECISNSQRRLECRPNLATGAGTGFYLVTEHQAKFARRGVCARDPKRALADGALMAMPRKSRVTDEFKPFSPAAMLPYATRWRLFRTPNDAFLITNLHREGISPFDILQPAYAALYSGALHPSAEAHAIVADHVMPYARKVLERTTTGAR